MRIRILSVLAAIFAIAAGMLISQPANATVGCQINPYCADVYNEQAGSNLVLSANMQKVNAAVTLQARNRQSSMQDFRIDVWSTVKSTWGGDVADYPFDDPELNLRYQGMPVFRLVSTPDGHNSNLYAGINNGLRLENFGTVGSSQRQRNLWVAASEFCQFSGGSAAINVGRTNEVGDLRVLTIHQGAGKGTNPFASKTQDDNLYQFPQTQTWFAQRNYP